MGKPSSNPRGRGPRPEGLPLLCDYCDRVELPDTDQADWWLDAYNPRTNIRVTRCPQHISTWALRESGIGRSKAVYRWARLAQAKDQGDEVEFETVPVDLGF